MPGSTTHGKHIIKDWFDKRTDIRTVLDVGCGQGTYPQLLGVDKYVWTGVDIWYPYREQFELDGVYSSVRVCDFTLLETSYYASFDCVIFGDVLEHAPFLESVATLMRVVRLGKHVAVSVPLSDTEKYEGKEHFGNPFEKHVSYWNFEDVRSVCSWEVSEREKQIGVFIK
jgi:2-polyprenyl-3-methyl-5-hydroxy-6-metoxy-1,4-benzoquinol methylase